MASGRRRRSSIYQTKRLDYLRLGFRRVESRADFDWQVQMIVSSDKSFSCPGCFRGIEPGRSHLVAWRINTLLAKEGEIADRRHWHRPCWEKFR